MTSEQQTIFFNVFNDCVGFCDIQKIQGMSNFIQTRNLKTYVEIGVYGGKSLLPNAYVMKTLGPGFLAIGIDPWTVEDAMQTLQDEATTTRINEGTKTIDFDQVYNNVVSIINKYDMQDYCKLIRKKSSDAISEIDTIDLLHIDGNHGTQAVIEDFEKYFPKIRSGGLIWFDDVHHTWPTVVAATEHIKKYCPVVEHVGAQLVLEKP